MTKETHFALWVGILASLLFGFIVFRIVMDSKDCMIASYQNGGLKVAACIRTDVFSRIVDQILDTPKK